MSKKDKVKTYTHETPLEKKWREQREQENLSKKSFIENTANNAVDIVQESLPIVMKDYGVDKKEEEQKVILDKEMEEKLKKWDDSDERIKVEESQRIDKFRLSYIEDYEEEEAKRLIEQCLGFEPPRVAGFNMAVKVYVRPEDVREFVGADGIKRAIYLPDTERAHDKHVNCVGLILNQAPLCYTGEYFEEHWAKKIIRFFFGRWMKPNKLVPWCKVGDWVVFDRNSGPQVNYRGIPVTYIHDKHVRGPVACPTHVTRY